MLTHANEEAQPFPIRHLVQEPAINAQSEVSIFTVDIGKPYKLRGRVSVDTDNGPGLLDIVFNRSDRQPFQDGNEDFSVTLSIAEDLT